MDLSRGGGLRARLATGDADRDAIMALRARSFPHADGSRESWDAYDSRCHQVVVSGLRDAAHGGAEHAILASLRVLIAPAAQVAEAGYAARYYDLAPVCLPGGTVAEVGRLCLAPGPRAWEALRLLLAGLGRIVDDEGAQRMIGCASFAGAGWQGHRDALALLAANHLGPARLQPGQRATEVVDYPRLAGTQPVDPRAARAAIPSLLRSYLAMGGWVSDHAVVDRELDTLHVLACVEVGSMPAARTARLRGLARGPAGEVAGDTAPYPGNLCAAAP